MNAQRNLGETQTKFSILFERVPFEPIEYREHSNGTCTGSTNNHKVAAVIFFCIRKVSTTVDFKH